MLDFWNSQKYDFFLPNFEILYIYEPKVATRNPHVIWLECLKILTQKIVQFVCLGGKVDENVKICFDILNTKSPSYFTIF
jgi:hypothetical protein